ncbi:transcriptional regulator, MarR family [Thermobaculum terrenum ATCC BAA-798]|uniref:Transcriptional regulator, MarR family n=1 Tax=Thermobaculum terrenum (strain ATCC BAA-798 / CCMEE 7001 / YNP1) TaxID=525904 RepID=D1CGE6_THET1|nr:MarR family transcriptional regulator [Thermobaculum terrenum]ACZ42817.1 transcriptional regulator, MarR family [Thermobaculum terrenum ATCC BAA-798]
MTNDMEALDRSREGPDILHSAGFLLSTAGRLARERFERAIAPLGLRARHFGVLLALATHGPAPQGEVADEAWMDKSTMVAVVDDLERWGLVERRRSAQDRRMYELVINERGREKLAEALEVVARSEDEWLGPLSPEERELLRGLLARLLYAPGGLLRGREGGEE